MRGVRAWGEYYTLGIQAGLWGYRLAEVEAFPVALGVKAIGLISFRKFGR